MDQLSLIRPKVLSGLIGQERLVKKIRKHMRKRAPKAWLFFGPRGLGKTSVAYILATALQCKHDRKFGECKECYKRFDDFSIYELNCAFYTGIDDLKKFISGSDYDVMGSGRCKVYILDECHMLSRSAQTMLLKYLENKKNKSKFILCSTSPKEILGTIRRRCVCYPLKPLASDNVERVAKYFLKKAHSKLNSEELVEALIEKRVDSPGLIAMAVEKYCAGNSPEEAADVEGMVDVDSKELCIAVTKGDLKGVWKILSSVENSDAVALRVSVVGWLKAAMLDTDEVNERNDALAIGIRNLCSVSRSEHLVQMAALTSELYGLCKIFSQYSR